MSRDFGPEHPEGRKGLVKRRWAYQESRGRCGAESDQARREKLINSSTSHRLKRPMLNDVLLPAASKCSVNGLGLKPYVVRGPQPKYVSRLQSGG